MRSRPVSRSSLDSSCSSSAARSKKPSSSSNSFSPSELPGAAGEATAGRPRCGRGRLGLRSSHRWRGRRRPHGRRRGRLGGPGNRDDDLRQLVVERPGLVQRGVPGLRRELARHCRRRDVDRQSRRRRRRHGRGRRRRGGSGWRGLRGHLWRAGGVAAGTTAAGLAAARPLGERPARSSSRAVILSFFFGVGAGRATTSSPSTRKPALIRRLRTWCQTLSSRPSSASRLS